MPVRIAVYRVAQHCPVFPPRHLVGAELRQVIGDELGVEEREASGLESAGEVDEGHLRGVAFPVEHALAEERRPEPDAVEAPDEAAVAVDLHGVAVTAVEQLAIELADAAADPSFRAVEGRRRAARD